MMRRTTMSPEETKSLGRDLAQRLRRGDIVALIGDLGSGKTQFVKGICSAFGVRTPVTSPTFVLLNRYAGADAAGEEILLYHLDLYRVRSEQEIYDLGYEELLNGGGIALVEWAERFGGLLPPRRTEVRFAHGRIDTEREIEIVHAPAEGQ